MKKTIILIFVLAAGSVALQVLFSSEKGFHPEFNKEGMNIIASAHAYPPGVGILSKNKNCLGCHVSNGVWNEEAKTIVDVLDATTKKSLKQADGTFLIETKRNEARTVLTVIGRTKDDEMESPYRNAWIYIDPQTIETASLSKFAPGWDCNLQMACRVIGDKLEGYGGMKITSLPMTIRPSDAARNGELQLQVMLTKGESVKGNAKEGMKGNYFEKRVILKVLE